MKATRYHSSTRQLVLAVVVLTVACALVFAPDAYLPMLARSFMLWWCILFAAIALFAGLRKQWWCSAASFASALLVLIQVRTPVMELITLGNGHGLRIAHMNVWQPNEDRARAIATVVATDSDLISVQEVSPEWAVALRSALAEDHPYHHIVPNTNCYGIALFSKRPFISVRTITIAGAPFIEAMVDVDGEAVRVFAVHATSPGSYAHFRRRNAQLTALAERIRSEPIPTLVIGDLNTVHWDGAYERFCARSGLRPINSPFTITWPSLGPFALIPLDHALLSGSLRPTSLSSFEVSGSDHRGLLAEVRLDHAR